VREKVAVQSIDKELACNLRPVVPIDALGWIEFITRVVGACSIDVPERLC
jgi:hypothetical protein